jgi:hypothetical protein
MTTYQKILTRLGLVLFFLGVIVGIALEALIVWGDMEAFLFTSGIQAEETWKSLKCPVFLTPNEQGKITAVFENPLDEEVERYARANITQGYITWTRQVESHTTVAPGAKEPIEWPIFPEDAAYGKLILYRVYVFQKRSLPSMDGKCGVVFLNIPNLTGAQVYWIMLISSVVLIVAGKLIWESKNRNKEGLVKNISRAVDALAIILLVSIVVSTFGFWAVGVVSLAIIITLIGAMLGAYVMAN